MNSLSWGLYAASVAGNVGAICGFIFYGGLIGLVCYSFGKGVSAVINAGYDGPPVTPSIVTVAKRYWFPVVMAGVIGTFTPTKETIYAIIVSEHGEQVFNSEIGGRAMTALNAWLDRQVTEGDE